MYAYLRKILFLKKDTEERRIILDLSYPKGNAINDYISKEYYLGNQIRLVYPGVESSKSKVGDAYSLSVTYEKPSGSFRLTSARLLCSGTLLMGRSILTKFLAWGAAVVHIFAKE